MSDQSMPYTAIVFSAEAGIPNNQILVAETQEEVARAVSALIREAPAAVELHVPAIPGLSAGGPVWLTSRGAGYVIFVAQGNVSRASRIAIPAPPQLNS